MHTKKTRAESSTTTSEPRQASKRKLPDPPDPDNLPIDYQGSGWNPGKFPSSVPRSLRPQHRGHHGSVMP